MDVLQIVLLGLLLGGVYALMATGLTLVFGVMRIVNLAHGAFIILAAYMAFFAYRRLGIDPLLSTLFTGPLMFGVGLGTYKVLFQRLAGNPRFEEMTVLLSFGIAIILEGMMGYFFTGIYRSVSVPYATQRLDVGTVFLPVGQVYGFLVSLATLGLLWAFLYLTRMGYAIRATSQNRSAAQIVGVNVSRVSAVALGAGIAMAGTAGSLMSYLFTFFPGSHWEWIALLLSLIVVGGLGSLRGALAGGIVLATAASFVSRGFGPTWSPITFYLALFITLMIKPEGLFGRKAPV
jgi:branched-chain amino acid transport system permease protein